MSIGSFRKTRLLTARYILILSVALPINKTVEFGDPNLRIVRATFFIFSWIIIGEDFGVEN